MGRMAASGSSLARFAMRASTFAAVIWPLSYAWVAIELVDVDDPAWLFPLTLGAEMGALGLGLAALLAGLTARRRTGAASTDHRRAGLGALIGGVVASLVIGLNVLFLFVLPR